MVREIQQNREFLEALVGKKLQHLCYPSGVWSKQPWSWLDSLGIISATTCDPGLNYSQTPHLGLYRFLDAESIPANRVRGGTDRLFGASAFGVGRRDRLLELEHLSEEIERPVPIKIETYGFDLGTGLPRHSDYRNLPYIWRGGFYHMDEAAVRSKLESSTLIIGNVRETVPAFLAMFQPPPIGFVAFDMDYLVDTGRLDTFQRSSYWFLPRLFFLFRRCSRL